MNPPTQHQPATVQDPEAGPSPAEGMSRSAQLPWIVVSGVTLLIAILWAYWPTLGEMVYQWNRQPDYSHGFLVLPIAIWFLWSRLDTLPAEAPQPSFVGALFLLMAAVARIFAGKYYLLPLDGWTIPITIAGAVWLLYGWPYLRWSLPAIIFLFFMVPIPYRAETWLKVPLQAVATKLSTVSLVCLGQPAIAEGNTILLGEQTLFVEEACSGLRILVGIFALAFAFVLFSRWSWWQKGVVLLAAVPVAITANMLRIVVTGLLHQWVSGEAAHTFSHDLAGFVMIPVAALLFWLILIYLDHLFPEVEELSSLPSSHALS